MQRIARLRILQQRLDPGLVRIVRVAVLFEEQLAEHERGSPADVSVTRLAPRPHQHRRDDRQQRGSDRRVMVEPECDESRNEHDPSADSEHSGEKARYEAERDREQIRHLTNNQTAMPRRKAANRNSSVRPRTRCCNAVAPATEKAAGTPTSAAYPTWTSPCSA